MDFMEFVRQKYTEEEQTRDYGESTYAKCFGLPDDASWMDAVCTEFDRFVKDKYPMFPNLCYGYILDHGYKKLFTAVEMVSCHEEFFDICHLFMQLGYMKGRQNGEALQGRDKQLQGLLKDVDMQAEGK